MHNTDILVGAAHMSEDTRQASLAISSPGTALLKTAAVLLVLLGLMAEAGRLGYGPFASDSLWVSAVVGNAFWNILAVVLNHAGMRAVISCWPFAVGLTGGIAFSAASPLTRRT